MLEEIHDSDELYRRIAPDFVKQDGSISSAAFKLRGRPDPSLSVDLARLTTKQDSVDRAGRPNFRLGVLVAQIPRSYDLNVRHSPENGNSAHSLIEGNSSKKLCKELATRTRLEPRIISIISTRT